MWPFEQYESLYSSTRYWRMSLRKDMLELCGDWINNLKVKIVWLHLCSKWWNYSCGMESKQQCNSFDIFTLILHLKEPVICHSRDYQWTFQCFCHRLLDDIFLYLTHRSFVMFEEFLPTCAVIWRQKLHLSLKQAQMIYDADRQAFFRVLMVVVNRKPYFSTWKILINYPVLNKCYDTHKKEMWLAVYV